MTNKDIIEGFLNRAEIQDAVKQGLLPHPINDNSAEFVRAARARYGDAYLPGTAAAAARTVRECWPDEGPKNSDIAVQDIEDAQKWRDATAKAAMWNDAFALTSARIWPIRDEPPAHGLDGFIQLVNGTDLHIGSGGASEVDDLVSLFDQTIQPGPHGILALGGDIAHFDQTTGKTTRGTQLEAGCDYQEMTRRVAEFVLRVVQIASTRWHQFDLVFVEGNHDTQTCSMLAAIWKAQAPDYVRVHSGTRPILHLGDRVFVFDHCYHVKQKQLVQRIPTILRDRVYSEAYLVTGHLHTHRVTQEDNGVWVLQGASPERHTSRHDDACAYQGTTGLSSYLFAKNFFAQSLTSF